MEETVTLYRPTGPKELELVKISANHLTAVANALGLTSVSYLPKMGKLKKSVCNLFWQVMVNRG